MRALDAAHKAEVRELLQKWNSIVVPNFENEAALLEIELRKRHQNELEQFRESIDQGSSNGSAGHHHVHYSGEILNLKKKGEMLGLQGFYKEAKKVKKQVKAL
jgi:hypothetical protein